MIFSSLFIFIGFTFSCFVGELLFWCVGVQALVTFAHEVFARGDGEGGAGGVAHEVSALAAVHLRLLNRLLALFFLPCHTA